MYKLCLFTNLIISSTIGLEGIDILNCLDELISLINSPNILIFIASKEFGLNSSNI